MCVTRRDAHLTTAARSTRILSLSYALGVCGLARVVPGGGDGWAWRRWSVGLAMAIGDIRPYRKQETGGRKRQFLLFSKADCRSVLFTCTIRLSLHRLTRTGCTISSQFEQLDNRRSNRLITRSDI